jgi:hypothetical protein
MQFLKAKALFRVYVLFLFLIAIVPIGAEGLNNISILDLRADYILHAALYLPWVFLCDPPRFGALTMMPVKNRDSAYFFGALDALPREKESISA